jgi:hypothetical protein
MSARWTDQSSSVAACSPHQPSDMRGRKEIPDIAEFISGPAKGAGHGPG